MATIFIVFVILMCTASSIQCAPPPTLPPKPYAIVAFEWPMAMCKVKPGCTKIPAANFRLHGVWPTHGDGTRMQYCTQTPFSYSALKDMVDDLSNYWPSYYQPAKQFWKYEWEKHGTCSGQSVREYFENSMELYKMMYQNIYTALDKQGVNPSPATDMKTSGIPIANYYDAMFDKLNLKPIISCQTDSKNNRFFLEMRFCATADLKNIQNCTGYSLDGCGKWVDRTKEKALFYLEPKS